MFTEIEYRYFELTPVWAIGEHRPEGAQQIPPVAFAIDPSPLDCIKILTAAGTVMTSDRYSDSRRDIEIGYI